MAYLIDTDIIIYSLKSNEVVCNNFQKYYNIPKHISVITYGELIFGANKSEYVEKNLATAKRIGDLFPIIDVSKGIIEVFGELKVKLQKKGRSIDDMDLMIAATAMFMNLVLVTNNEKHFQEIPGLEVENWSNVI